MMSDLWFKFVTVDISTLSIIASVSHFWLALKRSILVVVFDSSHHVIICPIRLRLINYVDTKRCCHQVKVNNRWEDADFRASDVDNYVRFVYSLQDGTKLKDGDFRGDPKPLIVADEKDLECPSIVFSLTRDDDKSNYGVVKYVANAEFGVPNQVSPHRKEHNFILSNICATPVHYPSHLRAYLDQNFVLSECCCVKIL